MNTQYKAGQTVKVQKDYRANPSFGKSQITVKEIKIDNIEIRENGTYFYRGFTPELEYSSKRFYFNENEIVN